MPDRPTAPEIRAQMLRHHESEGYVVVDVLGHAIDAGRVTLRAHPVGADDERVVLKEYHFRQPDEFWGGYKRDQIEQLPALDHPSIPRYRRTYRLPGERGFCVVQDYVDAPAIDTHAPWPLGAALRMAEELLQVLVYLEDRIVPPVVHRDVSPSNILHADDGYLLVDFLLVRDDLGFLDETSHVAGDPAFNAPEELSGAPVDVRCDLYSLGMTVACAIADTGDDTAAFMATIRDDDGNLLFERLLPAVPTDLDERVVGWLRRMTRGDANERFHHARSALKGLRFFLDDVADDAAPPRRSAKDARPLGEIVDADAAAATDVGTDGGTDAPATASAAPTATDATTGVPTRAETRVGAEPDAESAAAAGSDADAEATGASSSTAQSAAARAPGSRSGASSTTAAAADDDAGERDAAAATPASVPARVPSPDARPTEPKPAPAPTPADPPLPPPGAPPSGPEPARDFLLAMGLLFGLGAIVIALLWLL